MIRLGIHGAAGRMGRAILGLLQRPPFATRFGLVGALERAGAVELGQDTGTLVGGAESGIRISSDLEVLAKAQVVIDFSHPESALRLLEWCTPRGIAVVSGTTGLSAAQKESLAMAAGKIAVLSSPNMAIGVNLLFHLAEVAARSLGPDVEPEIVEIHHNRKRDAPSGTAQRLKEVVLSALDRQESDVIYGRVGPEALRSSHELGVHALRGGDVIGDHTVFFFSEGERIELTHRASSRDTFAAGALRAALFLAGQPAGLYTMKDVLATET